MTSGDHYNRETIGLLSELIGTVQQITVCGDGHWDGLQDLLRDMDLQLDALRRILPAKDEIRESQPAAPAGERHDERHLNRVIEKIKELDSEIQVCIGVLSQTKSEVEKELTAARQSKRALLAYGNKNRT